MTPGLRGLRTSGSRLPSLSSPVSGSIGRARPRRLRTVTDAPVRFAKVRAVTDRLPQTLRADALDNRERILDAARALFAAEGLNVPMREIARRAGVGPATLYRRFPTKQMLATEAFADQMRACHAIVDEGLADPDPWHGFCLVIEKICELHARDRGFTEPSCRPSPTRWTSPRTAIHAEVDRRTGPPRPGRRPPAPRLRPGRPGPHAHGQQRHPRHLTGRPGRGLPALRRARRSRHSKPLRTTRRYRRWRGRHPHHPATPRECVGSSVQKLNKLLQESDRRKPLTPFSRELSLLGQQTKSGRGAR